MTLQKVTEAQAGQAAAVTPGDRLSVRPAYLPGTCIELVRPARRARPPRVALFDFDGTTSQLRAGWAAIMSGLAADVLAALGTGEARGDLFDLSHRFILDLAGRPTLHQMRRLADEVRARGTEPLAAEEYARMYRDRLMDGVHARRDAVQSGAQPAEAFVVPGTFGILEALRRRGVALYLLSGTEKGDVVEELAILGLDRWFGGRVHAPAPSDPAFTKTLGIERILAETGLTGADIVGFGDGVVETRDVKAVGGTAVGVASNEEPKGAGAPDPLKRRMLTEAGADLIVPDYRECEALLAYWWQAR